MDSETPIYDVAPEFRYRFIEHTGVGFLLGAGGGSAFHFVRGFRCSPRGARLVGGVRAVGTNGPRVAGRWGAYMASYGALKTAMSLARRREDSWNSIAAAATTGGLFGMRRGAAAAARSALVNATLVAGLVGVSWALDNSLVSYSCRETVLECNPPEPVAVARRP